MPFLSRHLAPMGAAILGYFTLFSPLFAHDNARSHRPSPEAVLLAPKLVGIKYVGRLQWDYVFQPRVKSTKNDLANVQLTLNGRSKGITIIDGSSHFGYLTAKAIKKSEDTLTIRVNFGMPLDFLELDPDLSWVVVPEILKGLEGFELNPLIEDPHVGRYPFTDGSSIDLYGTKDLQGFTESVAYLIGTSAQGEETLVEYTDGGENVSRIETPDGASLAFTWSEDGRLAVTATQSDGSYSIHTGVDIQDSAAASTSKLTAGNAPAAFPRRRELTASEQMLLSTGLNYPIVAMSAASPLAASGPGAITVNVQRCAAPNTSAKVLVKAFATQAVGAYNNSFTRTYPATHQGAGEYVANIPAQNGPAIGDGFISGACSAITGLTCLTAKYANPVALCTSVAAAVEALEPLPGDFAWVYPACISGMRSAKAVCDANTVPGGATSPISFSCTALLRRAVPGNNYNWSVWASATSGGVSRGSGSAQTTNSNVPRASSHFIDFGGEPTVLDLITSPADPAPGQGYSAVAFTTCAEGWRATLDVQGTDGYSNGIERILGSDGQIFLSVPGAEDGVIDVLTLWAYPPSGLGLSPIGRGITRRF